ncbi:uncharacterized protein BDV17DRAFT_285839 [Aspergillus undulatus]|uniref:uncharacterized protein n=1 Tax=Aspergillus undulatus TaxID=1810928 RepID=UPI003CCE0714
MHLASGHPKRGYSSCPGSALPEYVINAARACAVAGYIDLYKELDLLPEVHVAEEACYAGVERSNNGCEEIWRHIVSQPVKYAIMNDYTQTVELANPRPASLNGDTAVYSSLAGGQDPTITHYFITEDWCIDDHDHEAPGAPESYYPFLYGPLPTDLPPINKDKLTLRAAYSGDISATTDCVDHNPFWTKWWSAQIQMPEVKDSAIAMMLTDGKKLMIQRCINARRKMSDDVTWVTAETSKDLLPTNIWFPRRAYAKSYERLARIRLGMLWLCLHVCIVSDYSDMWDRLLLLLLLPSSTVQSAAGQMPALVPPVEESEAQERKKLQGLAEVVNRKIIHGGETVEAATPTPLLRRRFTGSHATKNNSKPACSKSQESQPTGFTYEDYEETGIKGSQTRFIWNSYYHGVAHLKDDSKTTNPKDIISKRLSNIRLPHNPRSHCLSCQCGPLHERSHVDGASLVVFIISAFTGRSKNLIHLFVTAVLFIIPLIEFGAEALELVEIASMLRMTGIAGDVAMSAYNVVQAKDIGPATVFSALLDGFDVLGTVKAPEQYGIAARARRVIPAEHVGSSDFGA